MSESEPVPVDLQGWITERVSLIESLLAKVKEAGTDDGNDQRLWITELLSDLAGVEQTSRRMTHLLTA